MEKRNVGEEDRDSSSTLAGQCIKLVAANFCETPINAEGLPPDVIDEILLNLGPNLNPYTLAKSVVSEAYWKHRLVQGGLMSSGSRHVLDVSGCSKGAVLECILQRSLEEDDGFDLDHLNAIVDHVFSLRLRRLPISIDLNAVFGVLKNLTSLEIQLGAHGLSILADDGARRLGRALSSANMLTSLSITNSCLCDDAVKAFTESFQEAGTVPCIVYLDVSGNKITAPGLKMLLNTFASPDDCVLSSFVVSNNYIDEEGARYLGEVLSSCTSLESLALRLNRLRDEGGRMILDGLKANHTLQHLCLAGNGLGLGTAEALCELIDEDCGSTNTGRSRSSTQLTSIDLSSNELSRDSVAKLVSSLVNNKSSIALVDVRGNPGVEGCDTCGNIDFESKLKQNHKDITFHWR